MRIVIGLVAPSGSGKTTVANRMLMEWGFLRIHSGLAIKEAVKAAFELDHDHVDGHLIDVPCEKLGGVTPRVVLEHIGHATHLVAPLATSLRFKRKIEGLPAKFDHILVDGIRRRAEADTVRELGGKIVRVVGRKEVNPDLPCDLTQAEVEADYEIVNDGTLDQLVERTDEVVGRIIHEITQG